ncbi:MAG: DNA mismatch repair protein msh6 [Claussenomyces sp. TS43310]|nr:MAG: DNA mismatch repair protein msh6 [Claussenomyces sp. TS43310]
MAQRRVSGETTPARPPSSLKKQTSSAASGRNQSSILGFFARGVGDGKQSASKDSAKVSGSRGKANADGDSTATQATKKAAFRKPITQNMTPVPSSDGPDPSSSPEDRVEGMASEVDNGLPSPSTPAESNIKQNVRGEAAEQSRSPSRKAKTTISYAESEDDEDEDAFTPALASTNRRSNKGRKIIAEDDDDDDDFANGLDGALDDEDADMDDFVVDDDESDRPQKSRKRKRPVSNTTTSRKRSTISSPQAEEDDNLEIPEVSTAQQWKYDPDNTQPLQPRSVNVVKIPKSSDKKVKEKAHKSEPETRYSWLANITDMDRNPPGHPDYDPRTIYIPPMAWQKFTAFEKQYWEIKQKFWDTIVFFKKGKFYELYETDARIGHQEFDLKLTDRVNMCMVGVPESVLHHWANQFVAKGYKIARVDQLESALGKEMREREDSVGAGNTKSKKPDKIIHRELACVLTKGTLVEGSMLEDDMSTYCVSIKEATIDDVPTFGIAFIDAATGQFFLSEFEDDVDLTKFETFIAQTRPQELLLEKSCISVKAMRILKNNTSPTTIWNYLKSGSEFWSADNTRRELDCGGYFTGQPGSEEIWPEVLVNAKEKEQVMSATGALMQYLRTLKLERELISQGNFSWYDPIQKATTLVLDGQTLINLEIFANTFDGGQDGTLFALLNRCVTPFGKRTFKQWVCHPLGDAKRINERLDAVDSLNADRTIREQFSSQMTKMPDLERLISRIHAGVCKPEDFVRVLEGFEQIEYTMSLLGAFSGGNGILDRLISGMPDLTEPLAFWKTAFDRKKARDERLLIPERGIEEDFDASQDRIQEIEDELQSLLKTQRKTLGSSAIHFKDVGKEIYQLEVPTKIKNIPKNWSVVSNAKGVTRYYFPELKALVRELQEAQETHGQIVKATSSRFFARFDEHYTIWLAAVKIIAHLDCLISLAKASSTLGEPSCRPIFVDDERSTIEFEELRHPCMMNVNDFIPNDIRLGGDEANISLLTGANAAGKSTILRMTCIAIIMAQMGCYVPCVSARLTPVDRIMSRLGANDNIFAAQSTFFVELSETKKILSEATPRSLVILDELGRGTSSYDGVAVAQAVLHHIATHIGCVGFFATHYHSLATEFSAHPEIKAKRMQIHVDDVERRITFLYKLEEGVAEGSFGMHCAAMCGIPRKVIDKAETAAKDFEHTSRLKDSLEKAQTGCYIPLGMQSDVAWMLKEALGVEGVEERGMRVLLKAIEGL